MKRLGRDWMYERLDANKKIRKEFANGVFEFLNFAKKEEHFNSTKTLRCPCAKCKNVVYLHEKDVISHLSSKGFCKNYYNWTCHGEAFVPVDNIIPEDGSFGANPYRNMVEDAFGQNINQVMDDDEDNIIYDETPNPQVAAFIQMLEKAQKPVYEGSKMTLLESASRLITLKCEFNLPHRCVDGIVSYSREMIPDGNVMTRNFYETKKILRALELPHEKIHVCVNGCMLFWEENECKTQCDICGKGRYREAETDVNRKGKGKMIIDEDEDDEDDDEENVNNNMKKRKRKKDARKPQRVLTYFPLGPRLQRLYASKHVAEQMRWHHENPRVKGVLAHPSDSDAWKHFNDKHPDFASEPRNVRLGLCTDGFSPYGQFGKSYSCWPVILTPYNLPPWLCMKRQFMMLSLIVPGPKNPKSKLDVYLQPLIKELKQLWATGVPAYDVSRKQNFVLRAALLWTINDFPAYGMLSGWTTQGQHACPYCTEKNPKSFWLEKSKKFSWFDCHRQFLPMEHRFRWNCPHFRKNRLNEPDVASSRLTGEQEWDRVRELPKIIDSSDHQLKKQKEKREGWWKQSIFWELPYWKTLLVRHNLDVMHIEKNFFELLINTLMDVQNKTSFGPKGKEDLKKYCRSRNQESKRFVLHKEQRKALCEWVCKLKFPDGYASDLGRCVDLNALKLSALKSHDCHVFMERLLPVALKDLVPKNTWSAITEISQFFRDLCSSTLKVDAVVSLENQIAEIICKLEMIFPPSFFNPMEHLPIHLPFEAKVCGPVQYRWMYPFER